MAEVKWSDSLSVGVDLIDEQHKMLIQRLNDVSKAVQVHHGAVEIARTLSFLADYTDFHFSAEEKHMKANDYPGLGDHLVKHAEYKQTIKNLSDDFEEEGATAGLADSINTLLVNWLLNHIKETDVQFGTFLREKGVVLEGEVR